MTELEIWIENSLDSCAFEEGNSFLRGTIIHYRAPSLCYPSCQFQNIPLQTSYKDWALHYNVEINYMLFYKQYQTKIGKEFRKN